MTIKSETKFKEEQQYFIICYIFESMTNFHRFLTKTGLISYMCTENSLQQKQKTKNLQKYKGAESFCKKLKSIYVFIQTVF